jgi:hypothetical protein
MSYRHPNEIKENQKWMEKCMHDAVECALNEIMPTVMGEMESVFDQKMEALKLAIVTAEAPGHEHPAHVPKESPGFIRGIWVGGIIGACLFIGLVTGILVANVL